MKEVQVLVLYRHRERLSIVQEPQLGLLVEFMIKSNALPPKIKKSKMKIYCKLWKLSMRKAFSKINEKNCDVEKQVEVGCFFTVPIHSNWKTSKKDCGAHFKK